MSTLTRPRTAATMTTWSLLPLSPLTARESLDRLRDSASESLSDHVAVTARFDDPRTPEGKIDFPEWHRLIDLHRTDEERARVIARIDLDRSVMVRMGHY